MTWCNLIVVLSLALVSSTACRAQCPTIATTGNINNYLLTSIFSQLRNPSPDLVLVTAHRGDWRHCPENTIEAMLLAMNEGSPAVEIDLRNSADNVPFLTHDYDIRGEISFKVGVRQDNSIYDFNQSTVQGIPMVDRVGLIAIDTANKNIGFKNINDLLQIYYTRAINTEGAIGMSGGRRTLLRGSALILDIKGSDVPGTRSRTGPASNPDQFATFVSSYKAVVAFELANNIDLTNAIYYKISYSKMCTTVQEECKGPLTPAEFKSYVDASLPILASGKYPAMIFIVFPNDVTTITDPNLPFNLWRDIFSSAYPNYVLTDYQNRYPGNALIPFIADDISKGRGIAAFVSNNTFPEGYRLSGGTCSPPGLAADNLPCGNQPIQQFASATIEYFAMPSDYKNTQISPASVITTDWFQNATAYLTLLNLQNLERIR